MRKPLPFPKVKHFFLLETATSSGFGRGMGTFFSFLAESYFLFFSGFPHLEGTPVGKVIVPPFFLSS